MGCFDIKATIMCKLAYILHKRMNYLHAQQLFSEAASIGCSGEDLHGDFIIKCKGYAEMCHLQLTDQICKPTAIITTNDPTVDGVGDNETPASEDEILTLSEEHKVASTGEFKGGSYIMKGISRFIMAARAPQNEEEDTTEDKDDWRHNESNSSCPSESASHVTNDSTCMNSNNTDAKDNIRAGIEEMASEETIPVHLDYALAGGEGKQSVTARKPKFEGRLIPISDEHAATRYSSVVYPWSAKMLTALGVEPSNCDSIVFPSEGKKKILCNRALEYLLKQTEDSRAKYALEFEGLLVEQLNYKFMTMKSLLDSEFY